MFPNWSERQENRNFRKSHPCCLNPITKYQICIDIRSEHNYAILPCSMQRINYMFRPLLGHHQVVLNLQSNCTIQSVYPMGDQISFKMVRYMNSINRIVLIFAIHILYSRGTAVAQWLRSCATNRKVVGSIPDGAIGIFH